MGQSNIINLALLIVTAIGVVITIIAAVDARKSRDAAGVYEQAALKAKNDATAAAARSADAHERQADAAEAGLKKPNWLIEPVSKHRWKLTNATDNAADFVRITGSPSGHLTVDGQSEGGFFDLGKGQAVFISFGGGVTDPALLNITIDWRGPDKNGDSVSFTLP